MREGKPQAASALPSLGNRTTNERAVAGPPMSSRMRGSARLPPMDPMTAEFSMGSQLPSSQQVLPPRRMTGGTFAVSAGMPTWALIAIVLSSLAIVLSIGALVI